MGDIGAFVYFRTPVPLSEATGQAGQARLTQNDKNVSRPSTIFRTYGVNKGAKVKKQSLTEAQRSQRGMNRMNERNQQQVERRKRKEGREKLFELAIEDFERNLEKFREFYPVKTICMHGSPLSKWDNRDLWKRYDYRDYGIIAEPYFIGIGDIL